MAEDLATRLAVLCDSMAASEEEVEQWARLWERMYPEPVDLSVLASVCAQVADWIDCDMGLPAWEGEDAGAAIRVARLLTGGVMGECAAPVFSKRLPDGSHRLAVNDAAGRGHEPNTQFDAALFAHGCASYLAWLTTSEESKSQKASQ